MASGATNFAAGAEVPQVQNSYEVAPRNQLRRRLQVGLSTRRQEAQGPYVPSGSWCPRWQLSQRASVTSRNGKSISFFPY